VRSVETVQENPLTVTEKLQKVGKSNQDLKASTQIYASDCIFTPHPRVSIPLSQ